MFGELLVKMDDEVGAFLVLYNAFIESLKGSDTFRIKKLEVKVDRDWDLFSDQRREMILEQLIKDGVFTREAIEMVRIFNGKILSIK